MNKKIITLFLIALALTANAQPAAQDHRRLPEGWTQLHDAAYKSYVKKCETLIENKIIDVNAPCADGFTPLHLAASKQNLNCVKTLLEHGANASAKDNAGWTALHFAANNGNAQHIPFIIKKLKDKADIDARNNEGLTPLHLAARKGSRGCVRVLVEGGANILLPTPEGKTPLNLVPKFNQDVIAFLKIELKKQEAQKKGEKEEQKEEEIMIDSVIIELSH